MTTYASIKIKKKQKQNRSVLCLMVLHLLATCTKQGKKYSSPPYNKDLTSFAICH